jgi:hypothetical protein
MSFWRGNLEGAISLSSPPIFDTHVLTDQGCYSLRANAVHPRHPIRPLPTLSYYASRCQDIFVDEFETSY